VLNIKHLLIPDSVESASELAPWFAMASQGLVLCKDGSLLAGFEFAGPDIETSGTDLINRDIEMFQSALSMFDDRITLWTVQERRFDDAYPDGSYQHLVPSKVGALWKRRVLDARPATVRQHLYVGFRYPNASDAFMDEVRDIMQREEVGLGSAFFKTLKARFARTSAIEQSYGRLDGMIAQFEEMLLSFTDLLQGLTVTRLYDGDLLGNLYSRFNLASFPGPINVPNEPYYLDSYLPANTFVRRGSVLEVHGEAGVRYAVAQTVKSYPGEASSHAVDAMLGTEGEYVLVQCFRFIDRLKSEKYIQDTEQFYVMEQKSFGTRIAERVSGAPIDKVNTGNLVLAQEAQEALADQTANGVSFGYYNMTVLTMGNTIEEAENNAQAVSQRLRHLGFGVVREVMGLLPSFMATVPGQANAVIRWRWMSTANVADFAPLRQIWRGLLEHPHFSANANQLQPAHMAFLTPSGIPYFHNFHENDVGHALIVGGTGGGKTTFAGMTLFESDKFNGSRAFVFDKDFSNAATMAFMGGRHIDMSATTSGAKVRMNPVHRMLSGGHDLALVDWVCTLISAGGSDVSATERNTLGEAIALLTQSDPSIWRLSQLYTLVAGRDLGLAEKFSAYVDLSEPGESARRGIYSAYFDNDTDAFSLTDRICIELNGFLDKAHLAGPFMAYAFYCVRQVLEHVPAGMQRAPTLIYVEEAWYFLKDPMFASQLDDWLRTFRKLNAYVIFATQAIDEIADSPAAAGVMTNVPTKILLSNNQADNATFGPLYAQVLGLSDEEIDMVKSLQPKREYLIKQPSITRVVRMPLPQEIISLISVPPAKRREILELADSGLPGWETQYLKGAFEHV
jgi:type IV secretion system protein VirB4